MSRTVSLTTRGAIYAEQTDEVFVFLFTVTHPSLMAPVYYSSTTRLSIDPLVYGVVSRGNTYNFFPISLVLPDDSDATPPTIKLILDNVMRQAIPLLRSITTPPSVTIEMVLASDPDTVEASWPNFDMVDITYDANSVTIDLAINALSTEPFPAGAFPTSRLPDFLVDFSAFVGLPWKDKGRGADGLDCWGLFLAVFNAAGIELPSYADDYSTAMDRAERASILSGEIGDWSEVEENREAELDGALLLIAGGYHVGVIVRRGLMLHMPREMDKRDRAAWPIRAGAERHLSSQGTVMNAIGPISGELIAPGVGITVVAALHPFKIEHERFEAEAGLTVADLVEIARTRATTKIRCRMRIALGRDVIEQTFGVACGLSRARSC